MVRTKNIFASTVVLASCLLVISCGRSTGYQDDRIKSFSGADLVRWGNEAPTTPCDLLHRRKDAIVGLFQNKYNTGGSQKLALMQLGADANAKLNTQTNRCPYPAR